MFIGQDLYRHMPRAAQRLCKQLYSSIPARLRRGRAFHHRLAQLELSQWWSRQQLDDWQNERLRALIHYAWEQVPYYREVMQERALTPANFESVADLPRLPLLTREIIHARRTDLLARAFPASRRATVITSGTTGERLSIEVDRREEFLFGGPFEWRFYGWGGYRPGDRCAVLRANYLVGQGESICEINPIQNKVYFSIHRIERRRIDDYARELARHRPRFINAYPTVLCDLIGLLRDADRPAPIRPRAVFTIAEVLSESARRMIEDYFGCPVFDWYGMEERVAVATDCEHHTGHHQIMEYGVTELIPDPAWPDPGGCAIVATSLTNLAMPLIRYATGDMAMPLAGDCPCGRAFPRMKILGGRQRQSLLDRHGQLLSTMIRLEDVTPHLRQYQYVQTEPGHVTLRATTSPQWGPSDEQLLRRALAQYLGSRLDFDIKIVESIPRTAGGKAPLVLSRVGGQIVPAEALAQSDAD